MVIKWALSVLVGLLAAGTSLADTSVPEPMMEPTEEPISPPEIMIRTILQGNQDRTRALILSFKDSYKSFLNGFVRSKFCKDHDLMACEGAREKELKAVENGRWYVNFLLTDAKFREFENSPLRHQWTYNFTKKLRVGDEYVCDLIMQLSFYIPELRDFPVRPEFFLEECKAI